MKIIEWKVVKILRNGVKVIRYLVEDDKGLRTWKMMDSCVGAAKSALS